MQPWINHDRHRSPPRAVVEPKIIKPRGSSYPTRQRLLELFTLEDGHLKRIKAHGNERKGQPAGWINPKCGSRYIRIDDKQCKADKLIEIFEGRN